MSTSRTVPCEHIRTFVCYSLLQYVTQKSMLLLIHLSTTLTCIKVKYSCPALHHASAKGERKYSSYSFFASPLDGVSGQHHAPAAFYPNERIPGTHSTGSWVGLRTGLDTKARAIINPLPLLGIETWTSSL
jgi:hypothetical protein